MPDEETRRLAAVMLTDIVGYSALTQRDEALALRLLREHEQIVRPLLGVHGGREVKGLGDGFLIEFDSALEATRCAIAIQKAFHDRNAKPGAAPLELRIGIHLGDVIHRDDDVFGDAVNIAARIQPVADPGGICLSGPVLEQIRSRIDYPCRELPPVALKNIGHPVALFAVELPWLRAASSKATPWTGRERELEGLTKHVDAAARGDGTVVLLAGEAGIGKTRIAEEAIGRAVKGGFRPLRAHGLQAETTPPYSYWAEAARQYLRDLPPPALYKLCGNDTAEIVKLLPELAERLGTVPSASGGDPDQDRLRFYEGIATIFQNISKQTPILLFFDDLQWADPSSLRLVQHVARRLQGYRIVLLGAYRDTDLDENRALHDLVLELSRQRLATTVALKRLESPQVDQLVRGVLGTDRPFPELSRAVFEKTGGNPFFVEEVVRSLVEEGVLERTADGWVRRSFSEVRFPDTVRSVIEQRLHRLDAPTLEVLRWAAIIGIEFDFDLLQKVSGAEESKLFDILDGLLKARLVREGEASRGSPTYVFVDHQVRNALYEEMNRARRRKYHLQVARAMEESGAGRRPELAGELAHHYFEGSEFSKALEHTMRAAQRASSLYAHEESFRLLQTALDLVEDGASPAQRAELLEALGHEAVAAGRPAQAVPYLEEAVRLLEPLGHKRKLAEVLGYLAVVEVDFMLNQDRGVSYGLRQLQLLEEVGEGPEMVEAHGYIGFLFAAANDFEKAREHFRKVLELSRRHPQPDAEALALQFLGLLSPIEEKADGMRMAEEAVKLARARGAARYAAKIANFAEMYWKITGDTEATARWVRLGREESLKHGLPGMVLTFDSRMAFNVDLPSGAWSEAERLAEAVVTAPLADPSTTVGALATLIELETYRGQFDTALARFDSWPAPLNDRIDGLDTREIPLVELLLAQGDLGPAEREFDRLKRIVGPAPLLLQSIYAKVRTAALEVELRARQGHGSEGRAALEELRSLAEKVGEAWVRAEEHRAQATLAASEGKAAEARAAFRQSAGDWRSLRRPYETGVALVGFVEASRKTGETEGVADAVREARTIFEQLGLPAYLARLDGASAPASS